MAAYTCPTCGATMERDLSLFMDHTDKHIVDEVKRLHPNWVTEEGYCPKCLEYFKRAMRDTGTLSAASALESTNIGPGGVKQRVAMGGIGLIAALLVFFWLQSSGAPRSARLALFPFFFTGFLGFFQAQKKLCVVIAQKQSHTIRQRAWKIAVSAAAAAAALTVASFLFPKPAHADMIDTKSRGIMNGTIVSQDEKEVRFRDANGQEFVVPRSEVSFLEAETEAPAAGPLKIVEKVKQKTQAAVAAVTKKSDSSKKGGSSRASSWVRTTPQAPARSSSSSSSSSASPSSSSSSLAGFGSYMGGMSKSLSIAKQTKASASARVKTDFMGLDDSSSSKEKSKDRFRSLDN